MINPSTFLVLQGTDTKVQQLMKIEGINELLSLIDHYRGDNGFIAITSFTDWYNRKLKQKLKRIPSKVCFFIHTLSGY